LLHAFDAAAEGKFDPLFPEVALDDLCCVCVFSREDVLGDVEDDDLGAQASEGLGHFAADGAGANDAETARAFRQVEEAFVGEVAGVGEARDGWSARAGAGGDDRFLELKGCAADLDAVAAREVGVAEEDLDAELIAVAGGRVFVADLGANSAHAAHGGCEVDVRGIEGGGAELFCTMCLCDEAGGANDSL